MHLSSTTTTTKKKKRNSSKNKLNGYIYPCIQVYMLYTLTVNNLGFNNITRQKSIDQSSSALLDLPR